MTSSPSRCGEPVLYKLGAGPTANASAVHRLYQEVWSSLVASTPGAEIFDSDGVLIISAGGKWPVMNTAFLSTPVATEADLQNRISVAKKYFAQKRSFWLFILFNEWLDSSIQPEQLFLSSGLLHVESCIGMQTNNSIRPTTPCPELSFRLVETASERFEFSEVNADGYGFSSDWASDIATWICQWPSGQVRLYIAYSGDEPVSTAMVHLIKDVAYLGFVATRRRHQRKGYAEAIARYALTTTNEHHHFARSVLHSTPAALSLYRNLGYSEVTTFGIYLGSFE